MTEQKENKEDTVSDRCIRLNHKSKTTDHENMYKMYLVSKTGTYISANNTYRKKNVKRDRVNINGIKNGFPES